MFAYCMAMTKKGKHCVNSPRGNSSFCGIHQQKFECPGCKQVVAYGAHYDKDGKHAAAAKFLPHLRAKQ
ncbi:hypothetical protein HYS50_03405 [Candidatus Woesearchaeota archaeon]|nr:hypothetical protein [Candidatus Woesearchaeota archaeon]